MAVIVKRPMTPGTKFAVSLDYSDLTTQKPEKSLLAVLKKNAGRDVMGRVSVQGRGGGSRKHYRIIDFKRNKDGVPARVSSIEYDPCRNANICLLRYMDGEKRYILAPDGIHSGDKIESGPNAEIRVGNAMPLKSIPVGTFVHNIELVPGGGGKLVRAAGGQAQLLAKEGAYAILKFPSSEQRVIHVECRATIGQVGNLDFKNRRLGKAGKMRFLGRRPHVRGVAKNPCDHPHGGGEGRSGIGRKSPMTPWGKPALGVKTRRKRHRFDSQILQRRGK